MNRERYAFLWRNLSSRLRSCIAMVLMPNHGHIIVDQAQADSAFRGIRLSLLAFQRRYPSLWENIPEPKVIPDDKHLLRQVRYVHLNPCRSNLVRDPLSWEFSSHWDYLQYPIGSILVPPLRYLGFNSAEQFHSFVSSDPSAHVTGTLLPAKAEPKKAFPSQFATGFAAEFAAELPTEFPLVSLWRVEQLSIALTRTNPESLGKRGLTRMLFYSLANAAGYTNFSQIAKYLKITPQSISELNRRNRRLDYPADQARMLLRDSRIQPLNIANLAKT